MPECVNKFSLVKLIVCNRSICTVLFPSGSFIIVKEHLPTLWSDYAHIETFVALKFENLCIFMYKKFFWEI